MPTFKIEAGQVGASKVEVDGVDITGLVIALQLNAAVREPTNLVLQLQGGATLEGEGIIYIEQDNLADVLPLLQSMDPKELEAAAMNKLEFGDKRSVVEAVLDEVMERVSAAQT